MGDKFVLNVLSFLMISSDKILKSFSIFNEYSVNVKYIVYDHYTLLYIVARPEQYLASAPAAGAVFSHTRHFLYETET